MKAFGHDLYKVIKFLFPVLIIFMLCKNQEPAKISEQPIPRDSTRTKVQELMLDNQSDIEENINSLMQLIKEKEAELKKAQQELKIKSAELKAKEELLIKIEIQIKKFRNISYLILVIGLILIIIGLFIIVSRLKSRK